MPNMSLAIIMNITESVVTRVDLAEGYVTTVLTELQNTTENQKHLYIDTLLTISRYLWIILSPLIFSAGVVGNTLNVVVLHLMRSWHRSTVLLMTVLAFADMTAICSGLIRYWVREVFKLDIRLLSDWGCKINLFTLYISMQYSSWTRVSITLERFLMTCFPLKYNSIVTVQRTATLLVSVLVFLTFVNGHFFWTNGLIENKTECGSLNDEYKHFDEFIFTYVDLVMLSVLPFIVMLVLNGAIMKSLHDAHVRRKTMCSVKSDLSKMRKTSVKLTRTLLLTTTYFLIATVPISTYFIIDSYMAKQKDENELIEARLDITWSVSYLFQYTIYTVNFYLYVSANAQYRSAMKRLIGCGSKRERHSTRLSSIQSTVAIVKKDSTSDASFMEQQGDKYKIPEEHVVEN